MSITYTADVFCDWCGDWLHGTFGHAPPGKREARKAAFVDQRPRSGTAGGNPPDYLPELDGSRWVTRGKEDFCPNCQKTLDK